MTGPSLPGPASRSSSRRQSGATLGCSTVRVTALQSNESSLASQCAGRPAEFNQPAHGSLPLLALTMRPEPIRRCVTRDFRRKAWHLVMKLWTGTAAAVAGVEAKRG